MPYSAFSPQANQACPASNEDLKAIRYEIQARLPRLAYLGLKFEACARNRSLASTPVRGILSTGNFHAHSLDLVGDSSRVPAGLDRAWSRSIQERASWSCASNHRHWRYCYRGDRTRWSRSRSGGPRRTRYRRNRARRLRDWHPRARGACLGMSRDGRTSHRLCCDRRSRVGYYAMGGAAFGQFVIGPLHQDPQAVEYFSKLWPGLPIPPGRKLR